MYVQVCIHNTEISFLLDSGATASLISKATYERCAVSFNLALKPHDVHIKGVDGTKINVHGYIFADIALGHFSTRVKLIVCDMSLPVILGQDFMMVNIKSWDLDALTLCTKDGKTIYCNSGESTESICRVSVKQNVDIPPRSYMLVPVSVSKAIDMHGPVFIDDLRGGDIKLLKGVIDPNFENTVIGLLNETDETIQIENGQIIGECHPAFEEVQPAKDDRCASCAETTNKETNENKAYIVPKH